jgi:hypothetical protein
VLLTIARIALLAFGLLIGDFRSWIGWVTVGADAVFLAGYLRFKDIPPFVFYLLLTLVGVAFFESQPDAGFAQCQSWAEQDIAQTSHSCSLPR